MHSVSTRARHIKYLIINHVRMLSCLYGEAAVLVRVNLLQNGRPRHYTLLDISLLLGSNSLKLRSFVTQDVMGILQRFYLKKESV